MLVHVLCALVGIGPLVIGAVLYLRDYLRRRAAINALTVRYTPAPQIPWEYDFAKARVSPTRPTARQAYNAIPRSDWDSNHLSTLPYHQGVLQRYLASLTPDEYRAHFAR